MYRIGFSTKIESDVKHLLARKHPELLAAVIVSAINTAINLIGHIAGNLRKCESGTFVCERQKIRRCFYSPTVDDGDKLVIWASRDNRINLERLAIRTNDSVVFVSHDLPMLV
jgi:hypothetical protein